LNQILAIAVGGALGAVMRFGLSSSIYKVLGRSFPYGTLTVNVLGSFLIGLLFILLTQKLQVSEEWRSAIFIGFLGAFTTFSTFSMETVTLLESGEIWRAGINVILSVTLCIAATWLGLMLAKQL
jgi:CrcB protein